MLLDVLSYLIIWAWTEEWLVLILGSLPPLRPLFLLIFRRISTYEWRSRNKNSGYFRQSDPNDIPMHISSNRRVREDANSNSKREVPSGGEGILHITEIEILSNPKCCGEIGNDYSSVAQKKTTL